MLIYVQQDYKRGTTHLVTYVNVLLIWVTANLCMYIFMCARMYIQNDSNFTNSQVQS